MSSVVSALGCGSESGPSGQAANEDAGSGGTDGTDASHGGHGGGCTPSAESYAAVQPLFEQWCSTCHGASPQFGAPFTLLEHDAVLGDYGGAPIVDRIADALSSRKMPPAEQPQPSEADRAKLIAFATCQDDGSAGDDGGTHSGHDDAGTAGGDDGGGGHHGGGGGLMATREPLTADDTPPDGATSKDVTANETVIAPDTLDDYRSFTFTNIGESDVFVRRFDPVLDDSRVVHHLTLRFTNGKEGYLYTWAPGGPSIEFPDGGVRIKPTDTLLLEIHYNNGVGATGVKDSSGVRLWTTAPEGKEYGIANLATWAIYVPAGQTVSATQTCSVQNATHVFAAAPHMHGIGDSFEHTITRKAGGTEDLVSLTGWSFTAQRYYAVGVDLAPGDTLKMKCTYVNDTNGTVTAGTGTGDEMCFDFMYVTPPDALANCNDNVSL